MKRSIIIGAILLVIGIVIGWLCRQSFAHPEVITQRDSIVIVDTVRELYPVAIREEIVDSIFVVVRDTVRLKDTLYLNLPLEKRTYKRDDFYAEVTGYDPRLTYIEVYPKTVYINESVGQSVTGRNTLSFGIEPSYLNTLSIPIYLEYGRLLHKNIEIYGQIAYDLPSKSFGVGAGLKIGFDF
jgi:hypothetical protein